MAVQPRESEAERALAAWQPRAEGEVEAKEQGPRASPGVVAASLPGPPAWVGSAFDAAQQTWRWRGEVR